jgi:hypothetical protein
MKNEQLKELQFPTRTDLQQPVFTWAKTALIGDEHIIWWLYYGDAVENEHSVTEYFTLRADH